MLFWIIAFALTAVVAALILRAVRAGAGPSDPQGQGRTDMAIYRDQLAEVDRDLARGVLTAEEAARTRTEVARRLLAADATTTGALTDGPQGLLRVGVPVLALAGAGGLYLLLGGFGPDFRPQDNAPRADRIAQAEARYTARPSQAEAEAAWLARNPPPVVTLAEDERALVERLRDVVAQRPDELQGWTFLVDVELDLGNIAAAAAAQAQVLRLRGDAAPLADLERLLDLRVSAAGGEISSEAEMVLRDILRRDPENGMGLYYAGLMRAIYGRPDLAFALWRKALEVSPADAPWVAPIRDNIGDMAWFAGQPDFDLPAPSDLPGPTAEDIANAQNLSESDQQAMIAGMVEQLGERLATQGGTPDEWARFITALGVLGQTDRARAVWTEAQGVFAADVAGLAIIALAADGAGLTP